MARAAIEIILHGGEAEEGLRRYLTGQELTCIVCVTPDDDVRCNHLLVRLQWHTEGRGDRDETIVSTADLYQGTLGGGVPGDYSFRFPLPREPWSYAGHYINIVWAIDVDIDVPWSRNPRHQQHFILAPGRGEKSEHPAAAPENGRFDVFLAGIGRDSARVATTLEQVVPHFGRATIREMLRSSPMPVLRNVSRERADSAARRLREAGALVDIMPSLLEMP